MPDKEDWRLKAIDSLSKRAHSHDKFPGRRTRGINVMFDPPFDGYLSSAAKARGMSKIGYMRRAVAAFIAYDLGIDRSDVTRHFARPVGYGRPGGFDRHEKTHDDGTGYGLWTIRELIDGD